MYPTHDAETNVMIAHYARIAAKGPRKPVYPKIYRNPTKEFCANCRFGAGQTRYVNRKVWTFTDVRCGCHKYALAYGPIVFDCYGENCPLCNETWKPTHYTEPIAIICLSCGNDRLQEADDG